jgi:hypothetical protein
VTAAIDIGPLHVSAMASCVDDARSVVRADNRAAAVGSMLDVHAVAVDGANRSIFTNCGGSATFQRDVLAARRLMMGGIGAGRTMIAGVCSVVIGTRTP